MQVQIAGKHVQLGAALQERITFGLEDRVSKYFDRTGEAFVAISKPNWAFYVDCSVHLPSGVTLQAHGEGEDPYQAFETALDKIEKRVRRYKSRLRDHRGKGAMPTEAATYSIIRLPEGEGEDLTWDDDELEDETEYAANGAPNGANGSAAAPAIVAESDTHLRTMTVSTAVMQLELGDSPALMFRNAAHGGLNMVYRRPDGNVGWVDPAKDS